MSVVQRVLDRGQGVAVAARRARRPQLRLHAEGGRRRHQLWRLPPPRRRLLRALQAGPQRRVPRLQGEDDARMVQQDRAHFY